MGTETFHLHYKRIIYRLIPIVKLNNPLMGTETIKIYNVRTFKIEFYVKLNNPLMGTETVYPYYNDNCKQELHMLN